MYSTVGEYLYQNDATSCRKPKSTMTENYISHQERNSGFFLPKDDQDEDNNPNVSYLVDTTIQSSSGPSGPFGPFGPTGNEHGPWISKNGNNFVFHPSASGPSGPSGTQGPSGMSGTSFWEKITKKIKFPYGPQGPSGASGPLGPYKPQFTKFKKKVTDTISSLPPLPSTDTIKSSLTTAGQSISSTVAQIPTYSVPKSVNPASTTPTTSVTSTDMDDLYNNNHNIDPKIWGPNVWNSLHYSAATYPLTASPTVQKLMKCRIQALPFELPCSSCRAHVSAFIEKNLNNLDDIVSGRHKLGQFYTELHNAVNKRLGKPEWSYSDVYKKYSGNSTEVTYLK